MTTQLTTETATITTAAIQIRTLTIGRKQVTLAVFRQLREKPLIAEDGTLNGVPWGIVNYHPDKCGDDYSDHWHIVWQHGSELRRSYIAEAADFDHVTRSGNRPPAHWHTSQAVNQYLTAVVYMGITAGGDSILGVKPGHVSYGDGNDDPKPHVADLILPAAIAGTDSFPVRATAAPEAVHAANWAGQLRVRRARADKGFSDYERGLSADWQARARESRSKAVEEAQVYHLDAMAKLRNLIENWGGYDAINEAYEAEIAAEEVRRQQHRDTRAALADLPQLFIAV